MEYNDIMDYDGVVAHSGDISYKFEDFRNAIIWGDWLKVCESFPDESVDLIVSSPPYNLGKHYRSSDDAREFEQYLEWHEKVLKSCLRILKHGGRLAWQVGSVYNKNGYFPLHQWVGQKCREMGYLMRGEIIWYKMQIPKRTAWGSWQSASNNKILPSYEYIELFSKGSMKLEHKGENTVSRESFIKLTDGLWRIKPETKLCKFHPAPFPVEIPLGLIEMNSYRGDVVLDPFVGIGTTMVAARSLDRVPIGVELEPEFIKLAVQRLKDLEKPPEIIF